MSLSPTLSDSEDIAIRVRGVCNRFGTNVVHENLDLDMRAGEILGVVGGSGCGKSVLMKSILGLIKPAAGEIIVLGQDQKDMDDEAQRRQRKNVGVLFQDGALFSSLTVAQNIQVPLREFYKMPQSMMDEIAALKIALVGLPASSGRLFPSDLSGGMRKRAALARSLAMDPKILFLDEPTAGLDPIGAANFDSLIRGLRDALDLTVFLVTHDLDTLYTVCDRVAVIAKRKVIAVGPIDELASYDHEWIHDYFSGPRGRLAAIANKGKTDRNNVRGES